MSKERSNLGNRIRLTSDSSCAPWTERWEQHQKTRANVQEYLDRLADMESTVLNSQIAGANAIEGIETGNVLLMDDGVNE